MNKEHAFSLLELEYIVQEKGKDSKIKALKSIDNSLIKMSNSYWDLIKTVNVNLDPQKDFRFTYNFVNLGQIFYTRLTNIIGNLILNLDEDQQELEVYTLLKNLLSRKNTLDYIFSNSIYNSSDHLLKLLLRKNNNKLTTEIGKLKFKLFYSLESDLPVSSIGSIINFTKDDYFTYSLYLLSSAVIATRNSLQNKNLLLQSLPQFIDSIKKEDLKTIDSRFLASIYFNCTYSSLKEKHKIKGSIHRMIQRLQMVSITDKEVIDQKVKLQDNKFKKCLLIIHEVFTSNHALFRCYSQVLKSLKEEYFLIGVTQYETNTDSRSKEIFDEHFVFDVNTCLPKIKALVKKYNPVATYFPSIGMQSLTIFASSYKFTSKYILSSGHPAPTFNPNIDYVIHYKNENIDLDLEDQIVYKKLNKLIPIHLPEKYNQVVEDWVLLKKFNDIKNIHTVKIAITSSAYKLNISMLKMIASLQNNYKDRIEFNYFVAGSTGNIFYKITSLLSKATNGRVRIFPHLRYEEYMNNLSKCDLFLSPFPFGMSNSLMDCVSQGLLGACLAGETIVQDCEKKMFESLGLSKFVCSSENEYFELMSDLINCLLKKDEKIIKKVQLLPKPKLSIKNMSTWSDEDYKEFKEMINSCIND